jgi:hypothetical protein
MGQPKWKQVGNLGDVDFLEYGGALVFVDETGEYAPEIERVELREGGTWEIRRASLERLKRVKGYLVSAKYKPDWPHPVHRYHEWFAADKLDDVAESMGYHDGDTLAEMFCSDDPMTLARAYTAVGDYFGWDNLDAYPLILSKEETEKRYADETSDE